MVSSETGGPPLRQVFLLRIANMSSSSSTGSDCQITDAASPDLSPNSVLHAVPLRYIPAPDMHFPIKKKNMIWLVALSTFVMNRVCELVKEGMIGVQFFRNRDLKAIVQAALKFTGREIGVDQVYNHLRHWRAMWVQVSRLKTLEGVRWVENTPAIMMDDDAYYAYTKTHPRDADLINKPIENYAQMKKIYAGHVSAAPFTPAAVHRALSHLMDHKAHAKRYLAMTPAYRMAWFNAFLAKYYL